MSINTDPAALGRMAQELTRLDKTVQDATRKVRSQLNASQWNDPVRRNFEQLLADIEKSSRALGEMSRDGAKMLKTKEQQLRAYQGR